MSRGVTEEEALTSKLTQRIKRKTFQWGMTSEKRLVQAEIRESIFKYTEKDGGKEKRKRWDDFCKKHSDFANEVNNQQNNNNNNNNTTSSSNNNNNEKKIRRCMMKWKYQYSNKTVVASTKEYNPNGITVRTSKHQAAYRSLRNLFKKKDNNDDSNTNNLSYRSKIDKLIRGGIPPSMRGKIWEYCSGADLKRKESYETNVTNNNNNNKNGKQQHGKKKRKIEAYHDILQGLKLGTLNVSPQHLIDIDKDLNRTVIVLDNGQKFPEALENSLERILIAYCFRNPDLGYCQGMSTLGALLLLHMEEEKSFWVLSCIIEDMLPRFYAIDMIGIKTEAATFEFLVKTYLNKIYDCVGAFQTLKPFAIKWFLCLYVNSLPLATVLRVWDVFFHEGVKVLHRVGLSALYLQQNNILQTAKGKEMGPIFDGLDNATKECKDPGKLFDAMYGTLFYGKNFSSKLLLKIRRHVISNDEFFFIADGSFYLKNKDERIALETLKNVTPAIRSGTSCRVIDNGERTRGQSSSNVVVSNESTSNGNGVVVTDGGGDGGDGDVVENRKKSKIKFLQSKNSWSEVKKLS